MEFIHYFCCATNSNNKIDARACAVVAFLTATGNARVFDD